MNSRFTAVFLLVLVAFSMCPQTHAFTAGAGNIGKRGENNQQVFISTIFTRWPSKQPTCYYFQFKIRNDLYITSLSERIRRLQIKISSLTYICLKASPEINGQENIIIEKMFCSFHFFFPFQAHKVSKGWCINIFKHYWVFCYQCWQTFKLPF